MKSEAFFNLFPAIFSSLSVFHNGKVRVSPYAFTSERTKYPENNTEKNI